MGSLQAALRRIFSHKLHEPPNGGTIGTLVVAATFVIYAFVIGLESVFGLFLSAMLEDSDKSAGFTRPGLSWVGSTALFFELALGVGVGVLVDRLGTRMTCLLGSAVLTTGLMLASAATSEGAFAFFYAGVCGCGMALTYGSASIGISQYFTTRSAFANGISGVGIGVGTMVLSQVMEYSIARSGWRACMRLLGIGCGVVCSLASLAFVPIDLKQVDELVGVAGVDQTPSTEANVASPIGVGTLVLPSLSEPYHLANTAHGIPRAGRGDGSPLTALKVLQIRAPTEAEDGREDSLAALSDRTQTPNRAHAGRPGPHLPKSMSPLRINRASSSSVSLSNLDGDSTVGMAGPSGTTRTGQGATSASRFAYSPQFTGAGAGVALGRPPQHLRVQRGRGFTQGQWSAWGEPTVPSSPLATPTGSSGSGQPTPMLLAPSARNSPALAALRGMPGSLLLTGVAGTMQAVAEAQSADSALSIEHLPALDNNNMETNASLAVHDLRARDDVDDPEHDGIDSPLSSAASGHRGLSARVASITRAPHAAPAPHAVRTPALAARAPAAFHGLSSGMTGWSGAAAGTPPISPWLLPGGGSAASIVHQASLRYSALGALVRALEGEQQQSRAHASLGEDGEGVSSTEPSPSLIGAGMVHGQGKTSKLSVPHGDAADPHSVSGGVEQGVLVRLLGAARLLPRDPDGTVIVSSPAARVWLDSRFWAISLSMALLISSMTVPETHLAPFIAQDMALGPAEASRQFAIMGASGIVGRLIFGLVTLYYEVDLQFLLQSCGVATGLGIAGLATFGPRKEYLSLFSVIFGGIGGSTYGFVPPILAQFFGLQGLPAALGGTYTVRALPVLLISPLAGWMREALGDYKAVFFITGVLCVLSALPVGVLHCGCRRHDLHAAVREAAHVEEELGRGGQAAADVPVHVAVQ